MKAPYEGPMLGVVRALSGTPMLLVLAMLNLLTLAMVTYLTVQAAEFRSKERTEILDTLNTCIAEIRKHNGQ